MPLLIIFFLLTAFIYASVGFGGGSTYNALLALSGVDYRIFPSIALICNIIVAGGGAWRFAMAEHVSLKRAAPFFMLSIPMAWFGGRLHLPEEVFIGALAIALLVAGLLMLFQPKAKENAPPRKTNSAGDIAIGAGIGFGSGLLGIGGGILLAPYLHITRWGRPKEIAGIASFFIAANSIAGLAGQMSKVVELQLTDILLAYWPLPVAVLIAGQLGSRFGAKIFSETRIKQVTAILVLYVSARLLWRWGAMFFT